MDRLTTRNIAGVAVYKESYDCERCGESIWRLPDLGNGSPTDKLATYEDDEERGMLFRLKCKRGDTVYFIKSAFSNCIFLINAKVISICGLDCDNDVIYSAITNYDGLERKFTNSDIGKTVFLSKEDAEQAIKKLEEI